MKSKVKDAVYLLRLHCLQPSSQGRQSSSSASATSPETDLKKKREPDRRTWWWNVTKKKTNDSSKVALKFKMFVKECLGKCRPFFCHNKVMSYAQKCILWSCFWPPNSHQSSLSSSGRLCQTWWDFTFMRTGQMDSQPRNMLPTLKKTAKLLTSLQDGQKW